MRKMSTLYKKDPNDLGRVIDELNPENEWALNFGRATVKWDGTACAVIDGKFYRRYDAKINRKTGKRKTPPPNSIPCQDPDKITGHHPYWAPVLPDDPAAKWHRDAFENFVEEFGLPADGTYEACGPHFQGNPERLNRDILIPHGVHELEVKDRSFDGLRRFLEAWDIEGIVFHGPNGEMCKIRKSDFGIDRQKWVRVAV